MSDRNDLARYIRKVRPEAWELLEQQPGLFGIGGGGGGGRDPFYSQLKEAMAAKGKDIEQFHPVGGGVKLPEPFSEMTSTTRPTRPMQPDIPITAEDLPVGSWLLPFYGDRTVAGQTLTHIGGVPLKNEVPLGGGGRFGQENEGRVWASEQGRITNLINRQRELEKQSEGAPIFGVHVAMGPESGDFSKQTTKPLLDMMAEAPITAKGTELFNQRAAEAGVTNWPGFEKAVGDWLPFAPGGQRSVIPKIAQLSALQKEGFPAVAPIRKAITEPALVNAPILTSGLSVYQLKPGGHAETSPPPEFRHGDYSTNVLGTHAGNMGQVPFGIMFPDFLANYAAKNPKALGLPNIGRTVELQLPAQQVTPEWQDHWMRWLEGLAR